MLERARTDLILLAAFLLSMAGFAIAEPNSVGRSALALLAGALVVVHIVLGDEVERARNLAAAAIAFALICALFLGLTIAGRAALVAEYAAWLWAVCFSLFILSWSGLRLIRG